MSASLRREGGSMTQTSLGEGRTVLVDFPPRPGVKDVSLNATDLAERSQAALDAAMGSIREVAARVDLAVAAMKVRPQAIEVDFGIKLDAVAGAFLARAGAEAHLQVKVSWDLSKQ
jgi:hypothetical protein